MVSSRLILDGQIGLFIYIYTYACVCVRACVCVCVCVCVKHLPVVLTPNLFYIRYEKNLPLFCPEGHSSIYCRLLVGTQSLIPCIHSLKEWNRVLSTRHELQCNVVYGVWSTTRALQMTSLFIDYLMDCYVSTLLQVMFTLLSKVWLNRVNSINEAKDWLLASGFRV